MLFYSYLINLFSSFIDFKPAKSNQKTKLNLPSKYCISTNCDKRKIKIATKKARSLILVSFFLYKFLKALNKIIPKKEIKIIVVGSP